MIEPDQNHYFADLSGRKWSLRCTLGDAMMLEQHPAINISPDMFQNEASAQKLLTRLATETFLLLNIVVELTREQRQGQTVEYNGKTIDVSNDRQFCDLLEGNVLDEASRAFLAGLANCTPKLVRRGLLEALKTYDAQIDAAAEKIPDAIAEAAAKASDSGNSSFRHLAI